MEQEDISSNINKIIINEATVSQRSTHNCSYDPTSENFVDTETTDMYKEDIAQSKNFPTQSVQDANEDIHMDTHRVLHLKWGKHTLDLYFSQTDYETFTIEDLKNRIYSEYNIPANRQRFAGVLSKSGKIPPENEMLSNLVFKRENFIVLIGTPADETIFESTSWDDCPEVVNDLDWDYSMTNAAEEVRTEEHLRRLKRAISQTNISIITSPRPGKKLLVLDLDYTLIDCKGAISTIEARKRPFLDYFMCEAYKLYDLVIWSQTHWRWVEMKCTELGFFSNPNFKLCFVLDRSAMFSVTSRHKDGAKRTHEVKALEIIWEKFPKLWGRHNSLHIDDIAKNFSMNPRNGLKISSFRACQRNDTELLDLLKYLRIIFDMKDFSIIDHANWKNVVMNNITNFNR